MSMEARFLGIVLHHWPRASRFRLGAGKGKTDLSPECRGKLASTHNNFIARILCLTVEGRRGVGGTERGQLTASAR